MPVWPVNGRVALDTETHDPHLREMGPGVRRGAKIVGFSFAIEDGPKHYMPLRHAPGGNVDNPEQALNYLREQVKAFRGTLVGAKISYDLDFLTEEGCDFSNVGWFRDTQVAEPLIDSLGKSVSLNTLSKKYLGITKQEDTLQEAADAFGYHAKRDMWRLDGRYVGEYAEADVTQPLQILRLQEQVIEDKKLQRIFDLESKVLPVLVKMRRRGVLVDQNQLQRIIEWSKREELKASAMIKHLTGVDIGLGNVWQAEAMAKPLRAAGHEIPIKRGKPSVTKDWMEARAKEGCQVSKAVARARKVNKLRTTFAQSVIDHMCNGRIHCTFNQLRTQVDEDAPSGSGDDEEQKGAGFGRLSCDSPNMQQQPGRCPETAAMWRAVYIPEPGGLWAANDYSQQEPRWTVHYGEVTKSWEDRGQRRRSEEGLPGAKKAGDKYRSDPSTDNHQMMADMANIKRKDAKEIFLGLVYGMGGAKLCRKLGLPTKYIELKRMPGQLLEVAGDEGQALLTKFDQEVPFVKLLSAVAKKVAGEKGVIITAGGRHCHFPQKELPEVGYDWVHKALNRLIQGSSGDQTKQALVDLDAAGHYIQLQVHDEIDGSVADEAEAMRINRIMCQALPMTVPSKVDTEMGASWGHSMGFKGWPE